MAQIAVREIVIANQCSEPILVRVSWQKSAMKNQTIQNFSQLMDSDCRGGGKGGGFSIGIPGYASFGINGNKSNYKQSSNASANYSSSSIEMIISPFIDEDFIAIKPCKLRKFAVQDGISYISVINGSGQKVIHNWNTSGSLFVYDGDDFEEVDPDSDEEEKPQKADKEEEVVIPYCPKSGCYKRCEWSPSGKRISTLLGSNKCGSCKRNIPLKSAGIFYHGHLMKIHYRCPFCGDGNSELR